MSSELLGRVLEAGKYQKMAFKKLFPESANRHFEVIEHELKELFMEGVMEIANLAVQYQSEANNEESANKTKDHHTTQENVNRTEASKSNKIKID